MRFGRSDTQPKPPHDRVDDEGKTPSPTMSPFLAARHEFDNVFGNLARGKRNWQVVALISLSLLTVVLMAYVRLASHSRITPYVVEVDRLGRAVAFGPAEPLQETDRRVVIAQLTQFVRNVRSVVPSVEAERALINEAYTFVDQRGATFLNTYFADADHDPRVLGAHMTRLVEVTSVLAVPTPESSHAGSQANPHVPTAWKITWTEQDIPTAAGGSIISAAWEGFFTIRVIPPTRADVIQENPLGLYVTAITWTQLATRRSLSTLNGEIPE